jgi:hypothetical protein
MDSMLKFLEMVLLLKCTTHVLNLKPETADQMVDDLRKEDCRMKITNGISAGEKQHRNRRCCICIEF